MTPREYLDQVITPNLAELANDYGNVRLALNAVHAVDALAAHIFYGAGGKGKIGSDDDLAYREQLAKQDAEFGLLRDVAKAAKHVMLERGTPKVSTAGQISSKGLGWGEARYGEGRYGSPPQAMVLTDAGEHRVLETVIRGALAFLEKEMATHGL
ncbi:MAG: hypothetical protein E5V27_14240 [Mesorhizobium sp.]|nr:MAG: hypothetical protein E5V27_14240 [Mesorhizobium sp.]